MVIRIPVSNSAFRNQHSAMFSPLLATRGKTKVYEMQGKIEKFPFTV
jgi:hypothetical protein